MSADVWHANLTQKASTVGVTFPATPVLFAEEQSWVGTRDKSNVDYMPTVADVARNPSDGSRARRPYEAPIARRGSERNRFCLRGLNLRYEFWERVTLRGHPQEAQLFSGLKCDASASPSSSLPESTGEQRSSPRTGRTRPRRVSTVGSCSSTLTWTSGEMDRRAGSDRSSTIEAGAANLCRACKVSVSHRPSSA